MNRSFGKVLMLATILIVSLGLTASAQAQRPIGLTADVALGAIPITPTAGDTVKLNGYTLTLTGGATTLANVIVLFNDSTGSGNTAGDSELLMATGAGSVTIGNLVFKADGKLTFSATTAGDSVQIWNNVDRVDSLGGHIFTIQGAAGGSKDENRLMFLNEFKTGGGEIQYDNSGGLTLVGRGSTTAAALDSGSFTCDIAGTVFDINQACSLQVNINASASVHFDLAAELYMDSLLFATTDSVRFLNTSGFKMGTTNTALNLGNSGGVYSDSSMTLTAPGIVVGGATATPSFIGVGESVDKKEKELTLTLTDSLTVGSGKALTIYGPGFLLTNKIMLITAADAAINLSNAKVDSIHWTTSNTVSESYGLRIIGSDTSTVKDLYFGHGTDDRDSVSANIYVATSSVCSLTQVADYSASTGVTDSMIVGNSQRLSLFGSGKVQQKSAFYLTTLGKLDFRGSVTIDSVVMVDAGASASNATGILFTLAGGTITTLDDNGLSFSINTGSGGTITNSFELAAAQTLSVYGTGTLTVGGLGIEMGNANALVDFNGAATLSKATVTTGITTQGKGFNFDANATLTYLNIHEDFVMNFPTTSVTATITDTVGIAAGKGLDLYGGGTGYTATLTTTGGLVMLGATGDISFKAEGLTVSKVSFGTDMTAANTNGLLFATTGIVTNIDTLTSGAKDFNVVVTGPSTANITNSLYLGHATMNLYETSGSATGYVKVDSAGSGAVMLNAPTSALRFRSSTVKVNRAMFTGTGITDNDDVGIVFTDQGTLDTLSMDQNGTVDATTIGGTIVYGPSVAAGKTLSVRGNALLSFTDGVNLSTATSALAFTEAVAVSKVKTTTDLTASSSYGILFTNSGGGGSVSDIDMTSGNLNINTGTTGGTVNNAINIGSKVLNMYGTGTLTASNKVVLNASTSKLVFKAAATVSSVYVTADITSGYGIIFEDTGAITSLTSTKDFSVDIGAYSITITSIDIPSGKDLTLNGSGTLTTTVTFADETSSLHINGTLTVSTVNIGTSGGGDLHFPVAHPDSSNQDTVGIFFDAAGTISTVNNAVSTAGTPVIHIGSGGGTITNDITIGADSVVVFGSGTLTMSGTNGINLANAAAKLVFEEAATVSKVAVTTDLTNTEGNGVIFNANGTISTFTATANAVIDVDSNTATITATVALATAGKTLYLYGEDLNTNGTLTATGGISLNSSTSAVSIEKYIEVSSIKTGTSITDAATNGIIFNANCVVGTVDMTTAAGHLSMDVAAAKDVRITNALNLGAKTLTVRGNSTGEIYADGGIVLNDAASELALAEAVGISKVSVTSDLTDGDGLGIDFQSNSWIDTLTTTANVTIDLNANTGYVNSGPAVAAGKTLTIRGTGTLDDGTAGKYVSPVSMTTAGCSLQVAGALSFDKHLSVGNATTAPVMTMEATGVSFTDTITFAGNTTVNQGAYAITALGDVIATSATSVVTDSGTGAINLFVNSPKEILLDGDLTFKEDLNENDWTGFDNVIAIKHKGTGSSSVSSVLSIPVRTWTGTTNLTTLGTADRAIGIKSDSAMAWSIDATTATLAGKIYLADNDTMHISEVYPGANDTLAIGSGASGRIYLTYTTANPTMAGFLQMAGTDSFIVVSGGLTELEVAATGGVKVSNGVLKLPGGKATDFGTADAKILVSGGTLQGESNDSKHSVKVTGQTSTNRELEAGGTLKWLSFDVSTTGASTAIECSNYSSAIWVSVWNEGPTYDGSEAYPYNTIAEALAQADTNAQINVVAGKYNLTSPLTITTPVDLRGYKQDKTAAYGGTGVTDDAPELVYTGTAIGDSGVLIVKVNSVTIRGFKIDVTGTATKALSFTSDTTHTLTVTGNNFYLDQADMGVAVTKSARDFTISNNIVYGDSSSSFVDVTSSLTFDSAFTVSSNTLSGAGINLKVDAGNISGFTMSSNTFTDATGFKFDATSTNTGKYQNIDAASNTFKGSGDYAFYVTSNVNEADFFTNARTDMNFASNSFWLPAGGAVASVQADIQGTIGANDSIKVDSCWWGDVHGPATTTTADYANVSGSVYSNNFDLMPSSVPGNLYVYPITMTYYTGQEIPVKVISSSTTLVEFGAEGFDADVPVGPQEIETYKIETFYVRPWNGEAKTDVRIAVAENGSTTKTYTNKFNLGVGTIGAPSGLVATDQAGDQGGYVSLMFAASANHPGYSGTADDELPIDYYMVYRGATNDISKAYTWGVIIAAPKTGIDTVWAVVSTKGDMTTNAYYWVAAIKGKMPEGVSGSDQATAGAKVSEVLLLENVQVVGKSDAEDNVHLVSGMSNVDQALAAKNYTGANAGFPDVSSDGTVGLDDLTLLADNWGVSSGQGSYDPLFDFDGDGTIGLSDLTKMADNWGSSLNSNTVVVNNGMNDESVMTLNAVGSNSNDFSVEVKLQNITGLAGYAFSVNYNTADFEFVGIETGDFINSNGGDNPVEINNAEEGVIEYATVLANAEEANAVSGEGTIATLKFRFIGENNSDIVVDNIRLIDYNRKLNAIAKTTLPQPAPLPLEFALHQNYPNPFNPVTTVKFDLPKSSQVTMVIYNVLGQRVRTLINKEMKPGFHKVQWDGRNDFGVKVASGMYVYRIKTEGHSDLKKMVLLK